MDSIQSGLGCCGANSPSDWAGSKYGGPHDRDGIQLAVSTGSNNIYRIPESCCKTKDNELCENIREIKVADRVHDEIYSEVCKLFNIIICLFNLKFIILKYYMVYKFIYL